MHILSTDSSPQLPSLDNIWHCRKCKLKTQHCLLVALSCKEGINNFNFQEVLNSCLAEPVVDECLSVHTRSEESEDLKATGAISYCHLCTCRTDWLRSELVKNSWKTPGNTLCINIFLILVCFLKRLCCILSIRKKKWIWNLSRDGQTIYIFLHKTANMDNGYIYGLFFQLFGVCISEKHNHICTDPKWYLHSTCFVQCLLYIYMWIYYNNKILQWLKGKAFLIWSEKSILASHSTALICCFHIKSNQMKL